MPRAPRHGFPHAYTLYMSDDQDERLRRFATASRLDRCAVLRLALDALLAEVRPDELAPASASPADTAADTQALAVARKACASPRASAGRTSLAQRPPPPSGS